MSTSTIARIDTSHLNEPIVPSTRAETQASGPARRSTRVLEGLPDIRFDRSRDLALASAGTEVCLRSFRATDRPDVLRLYRHGLLAGVPDPADPATEIEAIEEIYLKPPQNHFWVAEVTERVIASVAIAEDDRRVAHVRLLRVDPAWKMWRDTGVAGALIERAAQHAREHDCPKLVLHSPVNDEWAIRSLHRLGFEYSRARELGGKHLLEFYLNIYERPKKSDGHDDAAINCR